MFAIDNAFFESEGHKQYFVQVDKLTEAMADWSPKSLRTYRCPVTFDILRGPINEACAILFEEQQDAMAFADIFGGTAKIYDTSGNYTEDQEDSVDSHLEELNIKLRDDGFFSV